MIESNRAMVYADRVMTHGFRRLMDAFTTAIGIGIAYALLVNPGHQVALLADLVFAGLLLVIGILSRTPLALVIPSSLPILLVSSTPLNPDYALIAGITVMGVRGLRLVYDVREILSGMGRLGRLLDSVIIQAGLLAMITVLGGSLTIYIVEYGAPGSHVHSLTDALWLTLVTITTVGYGDMVPVTPEGRMVASMLMLVGIGMFTFFLSTLAAGLVRIVMVEGEVSPLEGRKRLLIELIKRIEELDDDEYEVLKKHLDVLYTIATADRRAVIKIDLSPETLGVPSNLVSTLEEGGQEA
ncbi:MAG: potassium channel family protein [Desulfurococcales archaeon]|nr:potassium channel family protein [Desulfurococcales archaeon]